MPTREHGCQDLLNNLGLAYHGPPQLLDHLRAGLAELRQVFLDAVGSAHDARGEKQKVVV
jgi:hypothetical protein